MKNKIIVFSEPQDQSTNDVLDWLYLYKSAVCRLNPSDNVQLSTIGIDNGNTEVVITINQNQPFHISTREKTATWYRRGGFEINYSFLSKSIFISNIKEENTTIEKFIGSFFRKNKYINKAADNNINKLEVLFLASVIGLLIPDTIIATCKNQVMSFFEKHKECITKSINEKGSTVFLAKKKIEVSTTSVLVTIKDINDGSSFLPSLFQQYITKEYEIRSFYLDGSFWSMAIFSQQNPQTVVDFRNYDYKRPNRCIPYQLPKWYENKLKALFRKLNINCGSIDILKGIEDKYYFLEINPIGQFQWLSKNCNYHLEKIIAETLKNQKDG